VISQITLLYMRNIFDSDPELDNVEFSLGESCYGPAGISLFDQHRDRPRYLPGTQSA